MPDIVEDPLLRNKRKKMIYINSYLGGAFNPTSLSGFLAQWKDLPSTFEYGTGSNIQTWNALAGAYSAQQLTESFQPIDSDGVLFDGTDDYLVTNLSLNGESKFSIVAYVTWQSGGGSIHSIIGNSSSSFFLSNYMRQSDGLLGFTLDSGSGAQNSQSLGTGINFGSFMFTLEYSSGVFKRSYINTDIKIDSIQSGNVNMLNLAFALRRESIGFFKGKLHDVIVTNNVLTDQNRVDLLNYFT